MRVIRVIGEARFIVPTDSASVEDVWRKLTSPFEERNTSWHPSFSEFEPVVIGPDGRATEFEVRGSQGGRYPYKIEHRSDDEFHLILWSGPSKNPPAGSKEIFLGDTMSLQVKEGSGSTIVDIEYEERWTKRPWFTMAKCFKNGPYREIHWIFDKFLPNGEVEYVRQKDMK